MEILVEQKKSKNVIATITIGGSYYSDWVKHVYPSWKIYCEKHNLGLIVFRDDLISKKSLNWKKPYWQKLLIGDYLEKNNSFDGNICFLDADILINPSAPNIFEDYEQDKIALVSQKTNLPYPIDDVLRRVAFFRHHFLDKKYPLDSYLFASLKQVFDLHKLPIQDDFACTGLFMFNVKNHAHLFKLWYEKYENDIDTLDGGSEEVHLNYEIQNYGKVQWLDYKFQALWIYEMAWKYPFLYKEMNNNDLIKKCIQSSLFTNYFLHFAGAWEGDMYKKMDVFPDDNTLFIHNEFEKYMSQEVTGMPKGIIKPKK